MSEIIVTQGLSMSFGSTKAVADLDLRVEAGQVFGFLGPNGAGKTTTVRLLNGLLTPTAGQATVLGLDVRTNSADIRRQSGVLTESPSLYETLTARQNLSFFGDLYDVPADALPARVDEFLERFGLTERGDDQVGGFSKGMKQRLALARAFLHRPRLLFLDEPTAGLDPAAARMVVELIAEQSHHDSRTVFLCTHNLTEAQRLCDVIGIIDHGVLQAQGAPETLARQMWQRTRVEIRLVAPPGPETLSKLSGIAGITDIEQRDTHLTLELVHDETVADAVATLVSCGEQVLAVVPQEHTLEDIYFRLQENGGQEDVA